MGYYQVHIHERLIIERLYNSGHSAGKIARLIYRSRSTVLREIKRNGYEGRDGKWYYHAKVAQALYRRRQRKADRHQLLTHGPDEREENWRSYYVKKSYLHAGRRKRIKYKSGNTIRRYMNLDFPAWWPRSWRGQDWRKDYNRLVRFRSYYWEEFDRTDSQLDRHLKERGYRDRPLLLFQQGGEKRRKKRRRWWHDKYRYRIRESRWHDSFQGGFYPHADLIGIFERLYPRPKPKPRHTSPPFPASYCTLPFVSQQPEGRTMSDSQENGRIFKIPSLFYEGSLRFLLKSA